MPSGWSHLSGVGAAVLCRTGTKSPLTLVLLKQSVFRLGFVLKELTGRTCGFRGCTSPGGGLRIPIMESWIIDQIMELPDRVMDSRRGFRQQFLLSIDLIGRAPLPQDCCLTAVVDQ